jgi:anti-sigma regulatory factor (Ser/Thr protein kinase)
MSTSFELLLSGGLEASSAARRAIAANDPPLPAGVKDDVALLVTELITNAVRHGGAAPDRPLQVGLEHQDGCIRVEVVDTGTHFEAPSRPGDGTPSGGWGLFLVDRIAERWGVHPAAAGTCVWFEVPAGPLAA